MAFALPGTQSTWAQEQDGIVDNSDPGFTIGDDCCWELSTDADGYYGTNFYWKIANKPPDTATWPTELIEGSGYYEVSVWYPISTDFPTDVLYVINHDGKSDSIVIDQNVNGGEWVSFGIYYFSGSDTENVILSDNVGARVVADAVKFEPTDLPPDGIVDNSDVNFSVTGRWNIAPPPDTPTGFHGDDYLWVGSKTGGDGSNTATFEVELINGPGEYEVFVWYVPVSSPLLATNAPFTINHDGVSETEMVNQNINGGNWFSLGIYSFADDGTEGVILTDNADSYVVADAVRFTSVSPPDVIPPVIRNVQSRGITDTSVEIIWETDEDSDSMVRYGTIPGNYTDMVSNITLVTSHKIILGGLIPLTTYYFVVMSTDISGNPSQSSEYSFLLEVSPLSVTKIIVDNTDPGFICNDCCWIVSTEEPDFFGTDFRWKPPGSGDEIATWTPNLNSAGRYEVFVWYPRSDLFATNAPFTIDYAGKSYTVVVDQTKNGGQWVSLGIYDFTNNGIEKVILSDNANNRIAADAVMFESSDGGANRGDEGSDLPQPGPTENEDMYVGGCFIDIATGR
ncbi:MAG: hypothetical protein HY999_05355 [Nitrospinae bacterium]|nr:hypothetical protein [Nitrospinota bacterium]